MYKRSLVQNPQNDFAREQIHILESDQQNLRTRFEFAGIELLIVRIHDREPGHGPDTVKAFGG
jgi:hypothetical protein